jgi:hypothetical protein
MMVTMPIVTSTSTALTDRSTRTRFDVISSKEKLVPRVSPVPIAMSLKRVLAEMKIHQLDGGTAFAREGSGISP